jgi:hypothetical protein
MERIECEETPDPRGAIEKVLYTVFFC